MVLNFSEAPAEVFRLMAKRQNSSARMGQRPGQMNRIHGMVAHPVPFNEGDGLATKLT
jgi:hypothetical protein